MMKIRSVVDLEMKLVEGIWREEINCRLLRQLAGEHDPPEPIECPMIISLIMKELPCSAISGR